MRACGATEFHIVWVHATMLEAFVPVTTKYKLKKAAKFFPEEVKGNGMDIS